MLKKGDKVQVLDENVEGLVLDVKGTSVLIETTDGFDLQYEMKDLLKVKDVAVLDQGSSRGAIEDALFDKKSPPKRSFVKEKKSRKETFILEVDLHIEKLTPHHHRMENFDMLNLQVDTARGQLEFAISKRIPRIVFIHGIGEGVLKSELEFLFSRYHEVILEDANYQKYGLGATQIYIKQNPNR